MTITKRDIETTFNRLRVSLDVQEKALAALLDSPPSPDDGEELLRAAWIATKDAQDIADWPITSTLHKLIIEPGLISMPHTMHRRWPYVDGVYGNPWIVVRGKAGTFEWFASTYTKNLSAQDIAELIKTGDWRDWKPEKGEKVGIFVSALARFGASSVKERSNVRVIQWPY